MMDSHAAAPASAEERGTGGFPVPDGVFAETVTEVQHYTDRLFRFRMTRPQSFRFRSGEFVMIGLPNAEKPVYRAYSIASPSWDGRPTHRAPPEDPAGRHRADAQKADRHSCE